VLTVWANLGSDRMRWQNDVLGLRAAAIVLSLLMTFQIDRSVRARLLVADRFTAYWCHMSNTPARRCRSDTIACSPKARLDAPFSTEARSQRQWGRRFFVRSRREAPHAVAGKSVSKLAYCKPGRTKTGPHRNKPVLPQCWQSDAAMAPRKVLAIATG
jgi:hypothetical protein